MCQIVRTAPSIQAYFVGARGRYTTVTNRMMPPHSFSMGVIGSQPIVAERPMYFNYNNGGADGFNVVGYQS